MHKILLRAWALSCYFAASTLVPMSAQDFPFELLSNELIWYSGEFREERVGGIRSMNDGNHYTSLERTDAGSAIVKYSYKTGLAVDTVATSVRAFGGAETSFSGYSFSADEQHVLLTTDVEPIYRHSFSANFHVYDTESRACKPLTNFELGGQRLAAFSPNAKHVAFMRDNNVFIVELASMTETQVTFDGEVNAIINGATDWVYEEEFGDDNGMFWSPDGQYLAFMRFDESAVREFSMPMYGELYPDPYVFKYPKAGEDNSLVEVKVYDIERGVTGSAMHPKSEYIPRVKWGASSKQLLVFTMNRHQNILAIHMGDCTRDVRQIITKKIWSEQCNTYIDITDDITFLPDGSSFLMTSKRDEYNHVYRFFLDRDEPPVQLTSGAWDVVSMQGYDEKRKQVYFTTSQFGASQTHLARVDLKGKMEILHEERGTHSAAYSNSFNFYIHTYHTANTPPVYTLKDKSGRTVRELKDNASLRETLDKYNMQPKEFFTFTNDAGVELNAWMIKPPGFSPDQQYPVYVSIYGGPGVNTVTDSWGGANYYWHQMLAQQGYIVASVDPRGTPKRGRQFEHSTYKELGKLETEDFIDFGEYLGNQPYVNAGRIGIQGWSYGGFMTLLCMTKGADVYKAGISVAPVTNWRYYDSIYTERFMQTPAENESGYDDNSPVNHADKLKGSLLLVHGSADDNVHFQNSMEMVDALVATGKDFDFFAYPNRNHGIYGGNTRLHLFTMMLDFVHENL